MNNLEAALGGLHACWTDLCAAHRHAGSVIRHLEGAREARAIELADKLGDALAHCRRLCMIVEGDLRCEDK